MGLEGIENGHVRVESSAIRHGRISMGALPSGPTVPSPHRLLYALLSRRHAESHCASTAFSVLMRRSVFGFGTVTNTIWHR
jgi:hypothetical protein